jgi:hypothetical protein
LKPLLWGEPPAGCVPAPPQSSPATTTTSPALARSLPAAWGEPAPPRLSPGGGNGKGGDSTSSLPQANSYRDRAHRLCTHALVVASPLSVPPCFHTHSPWTRPKPRSEPGARCHSVGPGLLSSLIDLRRPAFQPGGGSAATAQSPGCRRRQSVASLAWDLRGPPLDSFPVNRPQAATALGRSERRG